MSNAKGSYPDCTMYGKKQERCRACQFLGGRNICIALDNPSEENCVFYKTSDQFIKEYTATNKMSAQEMRKLRC